MISFDEATALVRSIAQPLGTEHVGIAQAAGRVLAAPVLAQIASPRTDVSAMDGYAVREADLENLPARLLVTSESFAGAGSRVPVGAGECARVFTGSPLPPKIDRVVMQENVRRQGDLAIIDQHPGPARHVRARAGDFEVGDELLATGRLLDARAIVAAAGADVADLLVFARSRVTILSTGDELAEPGTAAGIEDAIPESVSFGVAALAEQWGAAVVARLRLPDDLPHMRPVAEQAIGQSDVLVVTGGASVGEKDFAKRMFDEAGLELIFSNVAIKPGKPVWIGRVGKTLIVGLPGNPTSALVTARLLLAPLLCGLSGRNTDDALRWHRAPLLARLAQCGGRETFHRARWADHEVDVLPNQDSSAQRVLAAADLLVRQRAHSPELLEGEAVDVLDF